ncbi:hypothetical protein PV10_02860 [Exophiala mesophila]|uniref:XPG-I domain-containing protein n=1 Tax=Exophiala mesophila TaxID=212818 RepID=A0A0D1ZMH9_EXOME|nr:uncharacterized protein PV10_02860 [Exophiala mesophila]KIV95179.1 hypothetical protein PV10_02860 [Exophiala mesophila]
MGIPGILKEIGKGERVALAKLAIEHFEKSHRPYRIAIDAAIWNFQHQAGQGGKNPALRTLFYRLLKLLALPIQPVFVYDGKNKPLTKRGKTVSKYGTCTSNETSKKLINAFRFPHHTAPGEAEAECAMLQRHGLVDAVMSQDVDAIMFGSAVTLRNWSKEATKHNNTPTHISLLDAERIQSRSGLDPAGMVLVALLAGGDYDENGLPGFGPGIACEAARAGFGADLLELVRTNDDVGLAEWRERLEYELETNISGFFKTKHKTAKVPSSFPDRRILSYYTNPAITAPQDLPRLQKLWEEVWASSVDVNLLRRYVANTFEWDFKPGAYKFVRVMAPALLADDLRRGRPSQISSAEQITERRSHFVTDGIPELRLTVIPADVVGIDLDAEEDSPDDLARLAVEEEDPELGPMNDATTSQAMQKPKSPPWLPWNQEKMWVSESIVKTGAKAVVEAWHQKQQEIAMDPIKFATRKCRQPKEPGKKVVNSGMKAGALLNYITISSSSQEEPCAVQASKLSPSRKKTNPSSLNMSQPRHIVRAQPSPGVQDFFKTTKSKSPIKLSQEDSDPFETLSPALSEALELDLSKDGAAGKHSRPSTSTSNSSESVLKVVRKTTKIKRQILDHEVGLGLKGHDRNPLQDPGRTLTKVSNIQADVSVTLQEFSSFSALKSSDNSVVKDDSPQVSPQRSRRRTRRMKDQQKGEQSSSSPKLARPRGNIESFFLPRAVDNTADEPQLVEEKHIRALHMEGE